MRMSDMTAEVLEQALLTPDHPDTRREHAVRAIARCAGVVRGRRDDGVIDGLSDWFEREEAEADAAAALARNSATKTLVHLPTARHAMALGAPVSAMALCSDAIGGVASANLGDEPHDMRQVSVLPDGDGYRVMVPLGRDVYHDGWRLLVRKGVIPATVATACIGRPATAIADHQLLSDGRRITKIGDDQNGFDVFELDAPPLGEWGSLQ